MPRFKKRILLREGEYHSPDGVLTANRQKIGEWANKFQQLKAKRFDIPVGWGHAKDLDSAKPIKRKGDRRRLPKDNAGWLTGFKPLKDGGAEIELDIPRADDADKVRNNLAEVSPVIWEKTTIGDGEEVADFVGAVDLVLHPVDHGQTKFEEAAIACSLVRAGKPAVYRFAEDDTMADDYENGNEDNGGSEMDTDGGRISKVLDALAAMDVILADDTSEENFLDRLESALLTAAAKDGNGDESGNGGDELEMDASAPEVAAMSLERQYLNKQHQAAVGARLKTLLADGKCTPNEAKQKKSELGTVRLSIDKAGNHKPGSVEQWIDSREAVPSGTFFTPDQRKRLSQLTAEAKPDFASSGEMTDEEADQICNQILGRRS